jgi:GDPmannose 4,6-dehydratase
MWMILQLETPNDYVCSTGVSHTVKELCEYVFRKLDLSYQDYIVLDEKFLRPEELNDLKGDHSKLKKHTGWEPTYTFESMLDEMIEYWLKYYSKK